MSDIITPTQPIYEPDRGWRTFYIDAIYTGPNGKGRWVPNVNDKVWSWEEGAFRVVAVDEAGGTYLSTLRKYVPTPDVGVPENDVLLGAGPGYQSESFRVYLDTSVIPHTLAPDRRTRLYGKDARHYKIFEGNDITNATGKVISANYDSGGTFLGDSIPLELAVMPDATNVGVMYPAQGYTMQKLEDGAPVTLVLYDDEGGVLSIQRMLVINTNLVRRSETGKKYIASIALTSAFLDPIDQKVIRYPINMPVDNLSLYGTVTYTDGTEDTLPVDGTRFKIFGLDNYVSTIENQRLPLTLVYSLGPNEYSTNHDVVLNRTITEDYWAVTTKIDGALSVKLFMYPTWINAQSGYRMAYWLCNLDRTKVYRVDSLVQLGANSALFDPTSYGTLQKLDVVIDLSKVDGTLPPMRHVQTFDVALLAPGTQNVTNWVVGFSPGQDPRYGSGLAAKATFINVNNWTLDISCGRATLQDWLQDVFYATQPLYNNDRETRAPEPNYFALVFAGREIEFPINRWNTDLTVPNDLTQGQLLGIKFLRREPSNDYWLGVSGMPLHRVN